MTTYEVAIIAISGDIRQTMHIEEVEYDGSPQDLAEDTAANQNIAEGDDWAVQVFLAGDNDRPLAEAGPGIDTPRQIAALLLDLYDADPIVRAKAAADLAPRAKALVAQIRRAAVYEATRARTYAEVAAALDVSAATINRLVNEHNDA